MKPPGNSSESRDRTFTFKLYLKYRVYSRESGRVRKLPVRTKTVSTENTATMQLTRMPARLARLSALFGGCGLL